MNNDNKPTETPFANLFEQAAQISKAHAYDIVSKQRDELMEENKMLRESLKECADFLNIIPNMRLSNKAGFDECINIESVKELHSKTKSALQSNTIK